MAKQAENVVEFDLSKYFGDLNKYVSDFKTPTFDFESLIAMQRKNFEALTAANQLVADAVQAILKRQAEIVRQGVDEMSAAARALSAPGTVSEKAAKQTELARDAFERTVANLRELGEMVSRSNSDAAGLLNKRFAQSLDELRDTILKIKA